MSSPSYAPDEPADVITDEVAWLQGAFVSSLLCGIQITLSVICFFAVLKQSMRREMRIALLVYILLLCTTITAGQEISLLLTQMAFVEKRNYPGGPNAFLSNYTTPTYLASISLFVVGNWMMESLLVWRCKVICVAGERPAWIGVIVPFVLLISEYVTGILFLHAMPQGGYAVNYGITYMGLSILLNISATGIIASRLLIHRRRIVREFGRGYGSFYVSVAAVFIESASLYTGFLVLVIISLSVGSVASNVFQQVIAQIEAITTLLIIYRIAQGKGWHDDIVVSSMGWRGSTSGQVAHDVIQLERASDPTQVG